MASRRGRNIDPRYEALAVAHSRSEGFRPGGSRPKPSKCRSGKALDAEAVERPGPRAAGNDHRQASILRRSKARDHVGCRASPPQRSEQSGGEFSSAHPATRADHEALQITATFATLRLHSRSDCQLVPYPKPRYFRQSSSRTAHSGDESVDENCASVIGWICDRSSNGLTPVKFTMPFQRVCLTRPSQTRIAHRLTECGANPLEPLSK